MHVIARPAITKARHDYPDAEKWLDAWWMLATKARWQKLEAVRIDYPTVDQVGRCLVFNVCGNKYRFIVGVSYADQWTRGTLFVKHFLTHAEYDKDRWKKDCRP
jgi:mRNA interferase HigB